MAGLDPAPPSRYTGDIASFALLPAMNQFLHQHRVVLLGLVALAILTAGHGSAFLLLYLPVPVTFWMVYRFIISRYRPRELKQLLVSALIWSAGIALILASFWLRDIDNRKQANAVAAKVEEFHRAEGKYPASLEWVGLDPQRLKAKLGLRYANADDKPALQYSSAFNGFDTYFYDFTFRDWKFSAE